MNDNIRGKVGETLNQYIQVFLLGQGPEIAIAVIIEKGWQGYTAAPVAREIFEYYFSSFLFRYSNKSLSSYLCMGSGGKLLGALRNYLNYIQGGIIQ